MARIVEQARIELEKHGQSEFDLNSVLRHAKVSRSSLYHHFGSKRGLIVAVETENIKSGLTSDNLVIREMIDSCQNSREFFSIMEKIIRVGVGEAIQPVRRQVIKSFAYAQHEKRIEQELKTVSCESTAFLVESLQLAKKRGWLKKDLDMTAVAFWLQSLFIGQIVNDIANSPISDEIWLRLTMQSVIQALQEQRYPIDNAGLINGENK